MGKGISQRRRLKTVVKANEGNLHKAKIGKTHGAAFEPLPEAPNKEDMMDKVPKSLRKMMKLKKAASEDPRLAGHGRKAAIARGSTGQTLKQEPGSTGAPEHSKENSKLASQSLPIIDTSGLDRGPVEVEPPKSLRKEKRDYLSRRKEKKKNKGKAGKDDQTLLEQTVQDRGKVRFGERTDAPLEVNLKRKHWQKERTTNDRCKELFLKQMGEAQRRDEAVRHGVPLNVAEPNKRQKVTSAGGAQASRQVPEELRLQVIEAYRAQKKGPQQRGATLASLAKLAKAGS